MSLLRSLKILLGDVPVGSLFAIDDGRVYFRFDDDYIADPLRPILSQMYVAATEAATQAQLRDAALAVNRGNGVGGLPPFFQNLLPEGQLRKHLIERSGLIPTDEFGLLAYCGKSLPGNVVALAEILDEPSIGRLLGQGHDSYEMSSAQLPTPEGISLSGVQPKVELVRASNGRYLMRSKDANGAHYIAKLPANDYEHLPEVEFASLELAKAAGVDVCQYQLLPLSAIGERLPFALRSDSENFLLVQRFDRDAPTPSTRRHMEDFAQVTGTLSDNKYAGTYAAIGMILKQRSDQGVQDVLELVRRIKVNELLGNFDAHLKNFSLLYRDPHTVDMSPAYDIVAYAAYLGGAGHALAMAPNQKPRQLLSPGVVRVLANLWEIPEPKLTAAIADTVKLAMQNWPGMIDVLPFTAEQRRRLNEHIASNASAKAWRKRHEKKL